MLAYYGNELLLSAPRQFLRRILAARNQARQQVCARRNGDVMDNIVPRKWRIPSSAKVICRNCGFRAYVFPSNSSSSATAGSFFFVLPLSFPARRFVCEHFVSRHDHEWETIKMWHQWITSAEKCQRIMRIADRFLVGSFIFSCLHSRSWHIYVPRSATATIKSARARN